MEVLKVALTGGPCGGKTTSLSTIQKEFAEKGYHVIIVPEAATILINSGIRPFGENSIPGYNFQRYVMGLQLQLEEMARSAAAEIDAPTIILCDRGMMDDKAYVTAEEYQQLVKEFGMTEFEILNRYDLVIHLKSLAVDQEELYNKECKNNPARSEDAEQAREKDKKTLESWLGHDNLKVIGNDESFEEKINGAIREIHKMLKTPYPTQRQEKYLVESVDLDKLKEKNPVQMAIEQYVKLTEFGEVIYRKSESEYETIYTKITKADTPDDKERLVRRKNITKEEYLASIPTDEIPLRKTRYCFTYGNQYFRLDAFDDGLNILEIEETNETRRRTIPSYIKIAEEVTDSPEYRNASLYTAKNTK